jgi:transcriptional regulator with XRE-family HTH domain
VAGGPTLRSLQLTKELRRLRERADKTIDEVVEAIGISKSQLSRIETGKVTRIQEPVLRAILTQYGIAPERQNYLVQWAKEAARRGWWQSGAAADLQSEEWRTLVGLEQDASNINDLSTVVLYGLLQTRPYAEALLRAVNRGIPASEVEKLVDLRLRRQERVGHVDLWVILTEEVLLRPIGGQDVMDAQLKHLVELTEGPRTTIQILSLESGEHCGARGTYTVLGFEPAADLQVVYVEGNRLEACIEDPPQVDIYKRDYERLRAQALGPDESVRMLKNLLGKRPR